MAIPQPSPRQQAVIDNYLSDPRRNATDAARKAGYKNPRQEGSRIIKQYRHLIDSKTEELSQTAGMKSEQILTELRQIATDPTSKDRLRALEILAKINGLMSDKPLGDSKSMKQQLEELLKPQPVARTESKSKSAKPKLVLVRSA